MKRLIIAAAAAAAAAVIGGGGVIAANAAVSKITASDTPAMDAATTLPPTTGAPAPTVTVTVTQTVTATPTVTVTKTVTATPTVTVTAAPTVTPTVTVTYTPPPKIIYVKKIIYIKELIYVKKYGLLCYQYYRDGQAGLSLAPVTTADWNNALFCSTRITPVHPGDQADYVLTISAHGLRATYLVKP